MRSAPALLALTLALSACLPASLCAADPPLTPEELVSRHLDAIGPKGTRDIAKTRAVQGAAVYRILVGGGGKAEGKTGLVSEGRKLRFVMKFSSDYRGETVVSNGDAVWVAFSNSNQSRSPFASFLITYDVIVREGLFGGALSTVWALSDVAELRPKLIYEGLKKIDGLQLHQLRYEPRKHTDVQILIFLDSDFRHVKTTYSISVGNLPGHTITEAFKLQPERSRLEERFSDFKTVDGLILPTHWNLEFTRELPNGSTTVSQWDLKEDQLTNNMGLDPRNFEVK
jgi:hypothetical protein